MTKNTSILDRLPPSNAPELSPHMRRFIRRGNDGTYAHPFDYEWAIALAAVNAGHNEEWLRRVLQDRGPYYDHIKSQPYPHGGKQKADRYVSKLYAKALTYREQHPPWRSKQDASVALGEHAAWVQTLPNWRGRVGNRNLEVLLAAIDVGIAVGSNVVSFSTRQLAEEMKRSQKTVSKAIRDLQAERWLLPVQQPRAITDAPTYKIHVSSALLGRSDVTNIILPLRGVGSGDVQSPPMVFDFLGFSAYRAWSLLNEDEGTDHKALVKTTRLSERTIREALLRLESFGLALKKDGAWYRVEADLDALAIEHRIPEYRAAKKEKHAEQRIKRMHDLGLGDVLEYHRKHDLVGEGRTAIVDEHSPALASAQQQEAMSADLSAQDVQARAGTPMAKAGAPVRGDGRAAISERGTEPVSPDDGRGVPSDRVAALGQHLAGVLANLRTRQSDGGVAVGNRYAEERDARCQDCGNIVKLSAPDLRPYSCAHCHGKFVFVDELALAVA